VKIVCIDPIAFCGGVSYRCFGVFQLSWLAAHHPFSSLEAFVTTPMLSPISPILSRSSLGSIPSSTPQRRGMLRAGAPVLLALVLGVGLAGCGVPSVADDAGSSAPVPSPTVTASPSPTPTPSPSPTPTPSPTSTPSPILTTQAPLSESPAPSATQEPEPTPEEETQAGGGGAAPAPAPEPKQESAYYPNCKAARAAGAAPLYRGDPGYREELDRDRDGIACEIK